MTVRTGGVLFRPALDAFGAEKLVMARVALHWFSLFGYDLVANTTQDLVFDVFNFLRKDHPVLRDSVVIHHYYLS